MGELSFSTNCMLGAIGGFFCYLFMGFPPLYTALTFGALFVYGVVLAQNGD